MRGSQTSEEAHRVVLEFKQREATARATASAVYTVGDPTKEERPRKDKDRSKKEKTKARQPPDTNVAAAAGDPRKDRICWDFRNHGPCGKGRGRPFSHDKIRQGSA